MPSDPASSISLVIPVYNERESLMPLLKEIDVAVRGLGIPAEILFIDDGSNDGSWEIIQEIARNEPTVSGLRFRKNFGKAAALAAGFSRVSGDVVLTLDADLQDDPKEIPPEFLEKIQSGFDVVSGWKKIRFDPWHKVMPSRVFNRMVSVLTGVSLHDHNCGFKAYRAEVIKEVRLYGEFHRFVPVLAAAEGFKVTELEIHHRPRKFGHSKFGARRFLKGFLDLLTVRMLTAFGQRPAHYLGTISVASTGLAFICLFFLVFLIFSRWTGIWRGADPILESGLLIGFFSLLLFSAQTYLTGLLGEYILARTPGNPPYKIAEMTGKLPRG